MESPRSEWKGWGRGTHFETKTKEEPSVKKKNQECMELLSAVPKLFQGGGYSHLGQVMLIVPAE